MQPSYPSIRIFMVMFFFYLVRSIFNHFLFKSSQKSFLSFPANSSDTFSNLSDTDHSSDSKLLHSSATIWNYTWKMSAGKSSKHFSQIMSKHLKKKFPLLNVPSLYVCVNTILFPVSRRSFPQVILRSFANVEEKVIWWIFCNLFFRLWNRRSRG